MNQILPSNPALAASIQSAMVSVFSRAWNAHEVKTFLIERLPVLLKDCSPEQIRQPDAAIAGPAVEVLKHVLHQPELSGMLARLLAIAIDQGHSPMAHPAFAYVISNLGSDEARLLAHFKKDEPLPLLNLRWEYKPASGKQGGKEVLQNFSHLALAADCQHPELCPTYIDNLCRLGLAEMPAFYQYLDDAYAGMEADPLIRSLIADVESSHERMAVLERRGLRVTAMGRQFIRVCLP